MAGENHKEKMARRAFLIVMCSVAAISTSSLFVRFSNCPAIVLAAYRNCIAALLLVPVVFTRYRAELFSMKKRTLALSVLAGICFGLHLSFYFEGVHHTTIAAAQVLSALEVIVVALALFVSGREKYSAAGWTGIAITLAGAVIVSAFGNTEGSSSLYGNLCAAASAVFIAAWTLISSRVRRDVSNIPHVFTAFTVAGLFLAVVITAGGTPLFGYGPVNYLCAFMMAVICSLLSHAVFTWSFKYVSPTLVTLAKLLIPVWGSLWGFLFLSELPALNHIIGGVIVIAGIVLYIKKK